MLDVYEEAIEKRPVSDPRLRIEHAQVIAPEDIGRFGRLGVIAAMQPTHATSDMYWAAERVGPERIRGAYAWRKLIDAGCMIACGSSFGDLRRGDADGPQRLSRRRMVPRGVPDDRGSGSGLHHERSVCEFHGTHKGNDTTIYVSGCYDLGRGPLRYSRSRDFVHTRGVYGRRREDCLRSAGESVCGGVT